MKIQVRKGVFETNSSSTHSLQLAKQTVDEAKSIVNVSNVDDMTSMFEESKFTGENGDISNWDVSNVEYMYCMFDNSPLEKNPPKWYK